ncbi:MAG: hypothetical protein A2Y12_07480 [Planctomycetes bacterium GWF2_42_9]|nr:MAG: hypothetical protein A2Y12_07480 [Planctomycetes bacterium GWF2_42_9]HAL45944.1 hypothetical protein [Phycisphaerales bacterium]
MNVRIHKNLQGFSLVELLVVISIIAILLAIMIPSLTKARLHARVLVVNHELNQIGLALEMYEMSNKDWPPVRPDCGIGAEHLYSLPPELIKGGYLPGHKDGIVLANDIEDKFYKKHAYRYLAVGQTLNMYGKATSLKMNLRIPALFPSNVQSELIDCNDRKTSPIKWVVFSLGPDYDTKTLGRGFNFTNGFPIVDDFWYKPQAKKGILTRIKTRKDQHYGTFQKSK